jgi:hypothetical protein
MAVCQNESVARDDEAGAASLPARTETTRMFTTLGATRWTTAATVRE